MANLCLALARGQRSEPWYSEMQKVLLYMKGVCLFLSLSSPAAGSCTSARLRCLGWVEEQSSCSNPEHSLSYWCPIALQAQIKKKEFQSNLIPIGFKDWASHIRPIFKKHFFRDKHLPKAVLHMIHLLLPGSHKTWSPEADWMQTERKRFGLAPPALLHILTLNLYSTNTWILKQEEKKSVE